MRILISSWPAVGHLYPMLPLAAAARRAGHEVVVTSGADLRRTVDKRHIAFRAAGPTLEQAYAAAAEQVGAPFGSLTPQQEMAASATFLFGAAAVPRARELTSFFAEWTPELVVHDVLEFAAPAAAEALGIRHVTHSYGPVVPGSEFFAAVVAGVLTEAGLPDPVPAILGGEYLDVCPPGLQPEGIAPWRSALPVRPDQGDVQPGDTLPPALDSRPYATVVYLTLGTITNQRPDVFRAAFEGCASLPVTVVATTGPGLDPADLGELPSNVIAVPYLSQALVLPQCSAVISHAGAGTMLGALCNGLPQLCLPQGTDQPYNAAALVRSGAGLVIEPDALTPGAVGAAMRRILEEPSFRTAAESLQAEIGAMPSVDEVVDELTAAAR